MRKRRIGLERIGGRKVSSAIETSTIDELVMETHRIIRKSICTNQDDAIGCYDLIIRNHTIINSRNILGNVCKLYCEVHDKM